MEIHPEDWQQLKSDVKDIKIAVSGDEKIGITGLASRVHSVEKKLKVLDIRIATIIGGSAVLLYILEKFVMQ